MHLIVQINLLNEVLTVISIIMSCSQTLMCIIKLSTMSCFNNRIKTHDSESRGQEEAGRTR